MVAVLLACGCSSDGGSKDGQPLPGDGPITHLEKGSATDTAGPRVEGIKTEKAPLPADGQTAKDGQPPASLPGTVCTQSNKTCPTGQKCVFLNGYNAPSGTCVVALPDACKSYDDPRCAVSGAAYGAMCGPYQENNVTTNICILVCQLNGTSYNCPPKHDCKLLNGFNVCIPQ